MASNVYRQAEKEIVGLRQLCAKVEGVTLTEEGGLRQAEKQLATVRRFCAMVKGVTAVEQALQEAGSLETIIADKRNQVAELEKRTAGLASQVEQTEVQCAEMRARANGKAESVIADAQQRAEETSSKIIAAAQLVAEEATAAALKINEDIASARREADRIIADARAEAASIVKDAEFNRDGVLADCRTQKAESDAALEGARRDLAAATQAVADATAEADRKRQERDVLQGEIDNLKRKFAI